MRTRMLVSLTTVLLLSTSGAGTSDAGEGLEQASFAKDTAGSAPASTTGAGLVSPWIHHSMPASTREKLETAFDLAIERVSEVPECRGLFTALGADAVQTLNTGLYFPASPARETSVCQRSMAQTYVGDAPTWICRRITSYSDKRVALVLIHEALHHAGLTEKPHDRDAMSSGAINKMVSKSCDL